MDCFKKGKAARGAWAAVLAATLALGGCKDVDSSLGSDLIPDDQKMTLKIATFTDMLDTYMAKADSIPYSNKGAIVLGASQDPVFGKTTAGAMLQYYPIDFDDKENYYGYNPVADSVYIFLYVAAVANADAAAEQTFNIYPMTELMKPDSTYYPDIDLSGKYDAAKPLFSFRMKNVRLGTFAQKLTPTADGEEFLRELLAVDKDTYADTAAYRSQFKGFYIAPAPESRQDGNLYSILLYDDQTYYQTSDFEVFAHNYDQATGSVQDTIRQGYTFNDTRAGMPSLSLTSLKRDYAGSEVGAVPFTEFTRTGAPQGTVVSKLYLQSGQGVYPFIYFSDELIDAINALKPAGQEDKYDLIVNDAYLRFPLADPTVDNLNWSSSRIGMYYTYKGDFAAIPDYDYVNEKQNKLRLKYGGYIDRSKNEYRMDISSYLIAMLRDMEPGQVKPAAGKETQRTIALAESFYNILISQNQTMLNGRNPAGNPNTQPIELKITYTLIKKLR